MIIPIRCFNCGNILADKWNNYLEELMKNINTETLNKDKEFISLDETNNHKTHEFIALEKVGIHKMCCRSIMLSTIDLTEIITK